MKLNLLPTYVSKEKSAKTALVFSVLIAALAILAAVWMRVSSRQSLADAKELARSHMEQAAAAVRTSKEADSIIQSARGIIVNMDLAQAMMTHNAKYPALYDEIRRYVPSFFRVMSMNAAPNGPENCVVTLQGVVRTYQEYADVMLALLRIPDAQAVSRNGYQIVDQTVPSLIEQDQTGRPIRPGEANIPDDPVARLDYFLSRGRQDGFTGVGGFGTDGLEPRGAMPDWSEITVTVALKRNLQAPDHRATLAAANTGGAPAPGTAPAPAPAPAPTPSGGGRPSRDEEGAQ